MRLLEALQWRLKFKPKDGVQVLVRGRIDIYEQRSEYQCYRRIRSSLRATAGR